MRMKFLLEQIDTSVGLISSSENMWAKFKRTNNISVSNELTTLMPNICINENNLVQDYL